MNTPRIITPADVMAERIEAEGVYHVSTLARVRRESFLAECLRLHRLVSGPFCGMTSRPAPWRVQGPVQFTADQPPMMLTRKFAGPELAVECGLWSRWLLSALEVCTYTADGGRVPVPLAEVAKRFEKPPTRPMLSVVWPSIGLGPDPVKRRRRARRS